MAKDYAALFAGAPPDTLRLESTPLYLYLPAARRRIADELPDVRLLVVIRDPIDRAYSNWMHLWVDRLEPLGDFVAAWRAEDRVAAGWTPFWHYRRLGRCGERLADLFPQADRERVLVLRYWQLVSRPTETLNRVARFWGWPRTRSAPYHRTTPGPCPGQASRPPCSAGRSEPGPPPASCSRRSSGVR